MPFGVAYNSVLNKVCGGWLLVILSALLTGLGFIVSRKIGQKRYSK